MTGYATGSAAAAAAHHVAVRPLSWNPAVHLLSRFAFGATPSQLHQVQAHGVDAWWAEQVRLGHKYPNYAAHQQVAAVGPMLRMSPAQIDTQLSRVHRRYAWDALDQLTMVTTGLQIWSPAQLFETVVDFFGNHLNAPAHNGDLWNTRHTLDRDVIRKHAFGTFSDMLVASARNPAMLLFLNNAESNKTAVNENYGREILELHTIGLTYTEADVKNSARILTGRTVTDHAYSFKYDPTIHWKGHVAVHGFTAANGTAGGGLGVSESYLKYLAAHPDTARHLATKLCLRYVSDNPSAALIHSVTQAYLTSETAILPTLHAIFTSIEFWQSRGKKVRRPTENLVAAARTLGVRPNSFTKALNSFNWMTSNLNDRPLDWVPPNGYPDEASEWRSSSGLLALWQLQEGLAGSWYNGFAKLDLTTLYGSPRPKTSGDAVAALTKRLTYETWSGAHQLAVQRLLNEPGNTPLAKSDLRWMLPPVVALILHSPQHALR
jgi:hypothetical protein